MKQRKKDWRLHAAQAYHPPSVVFSDPVQILFLHRVIKAKRRVKTERSNEKNMMVSTLKARRWMAKAIIWTFNAKGQKLKIKYRKLNAETQMQRAETNNAREFQNVEWKSRKLKSHAGHRKWKSESRIHNLEFWKKCHQAAIRIKDGKLKSKIRITEKKR